MSSRRMKGRRKNQSSKLTQAWKSQPGGYYIPDVFRTTLRTSFERTAACSTSAGQLLFQANSAFDPFGSSGSAQPVGYDQMALMYNRYRVLRSRITARTALQPTGNAPAITGATCEIALCYQNDTNNIASATVAGSQPGAKFVLTTLQKPALISMEASTAHVTGRKSVEGSDSLQALVSADPAEVWYWASYFVSGAAYTDINLEIHYVLEQDVEFFDRVTLSHSLFTAALKAAVRVKCELTAKALVEGKANLAKQRGELKVEIKGLDVTDDDEAPVIVTIPGKNGQPQARVSCVESSLLKLLTPSVKSRQ